MTSTADQKYSDRAGYFKGGWNIMKKKLIALLLASSMALTGFASVYGAEDFTDPGDGAAMESVTENEWDEDCFSDTEDGDFTSEESGDALFSDEKEIPAVQNGEVWIENAGQGMTAGTSVYNSKSSFGRRKTFPQLADMGNSPGSYSLNWANPEYTSYYTDTAGNLHIVAWKNQILYDVSCNPDLNLNAFMIITDKNSMASRFIWLTQYSPSGDVIRLTEPKLIPVGNNQYAVLFSDETSKQSVLHYLLMDGSGNILLSKLYKNVTIQTDSQPILWGRNIVWTSGNYDNHNYDGTETFLYEIPVVTTPLSGIALDQTSLTLDEGKTQKLTPSFAPVDSDDVKDMSWTSSNPKIVSVSADGTIKGNGYGQAVITASTGEFQAQCQVTVRVSETDDPLATPTLKLSQKAANKMRLIWKKVPGAKGYQIYCKTNSQSSYKRIKTLKTWSVSYDAAVVPGVKYSFKVRAYGTNASGKTKYSRFSPVKSQKAVVPAPSKISCKMSTGGTLVSWSKVAGASGYVIYRNGEAAKTVKASISSWKDPESYDSQTGMYWIDNYYIKAFKNVNGKRIYSKPTKAVNFRS